jgi:hypothetical protein
MAVLGCGGRVRLKREAPEPTVLRSRNVHTPSRSIYLRNKAFWSGDLVTITSVNGLPIDTGSDGPDCPDGYATYAESVWQLGSNRDHISDNTDNFYSATNTDQFYMREEECGLTTVATYYIYRDQLDKVSFYTTRAAALAGATAGRVELFYVDFGSLIIAAAGTEDYQNAIADCAAQIGDYNFSDAQDEVTLESICDFAPDYELPASYITEYDNADLTPRFYINAGGAGALWLVQGFLSEWSLNLTAPEVDTTSVGEKFGDAIKSLVSGGGSMDFLVDRQSSSDSFGSTNEDSTSLMQLLLLTEKGCKAEAQFWMIENREASGSLLPGDLYYETELLITSMAINTRAGDLIAGSLNFVTVGDISLRMGPN